MSINKTLTSTVAALATVGAIGFAYAQTTNTDPQAQTTPSQVINTQDGNSASTPVTAPESSSGTSGSMSTDTSSSAPASDTLQTTERDAQADRN
jgi:hypothetical protein